MAAQKTLARGRGTFLDNLAHEVVPEAEAESVDAQDSALAEALKLLDLNLDPASREVTRGRRRITLTAREYALLEYFLRNIGRVLTRPMIAQHVWGLDFDPESNIVDVYVGYLRRKIDGEGDRRLLHTLRGAGYKLAAEE